LWCHFGSQDVVKRECHHLRGSTAFTPVCHAVQAYITI
jgi:hypothetical protein